MARLSRILSVATLFVFTLLVTAQSVAAQAAGQTAPRTINPCTAGNCVPEAPVAIILPVVTVLALGIVWLILARSRRADRLTDAG